MPWRLLQSCWAATARGRAFPAASPWFLVPRSACGSNSPLPRGARAFGTTFAAPEETERCPVSAPALSAVTPNGRARPEAARRSAQKPGFSSAALAATAADESAVLQRFESFLGAGGVGPGPKASCHPTDLDLLLWASLSAAPGSKALPLLLGVYENLDPKDQRADFFHLMANSMGVKGEAVDSAITAWGNLMARVESADSRTQATLRGIKLLQEACHPPYVDLFRRIGQHAGGIHFLVQLRADLMDAIKSSPSTAAPLRAMNESLRSLLADWFSVGITRMERISWEHSPASLLEKVVAGEAVHSIRGWRDLRRRLSPSKRVYALFHPSMPDEPLVLLHTALRHDIASRNIQRLAKTVAEGLHAPVDGKKLRVVASLPAEQEHPQDATTAVFYSISNTQRGLKGVDLGNLIIKQAARLLLTEIPSLHTLVTLSPIPGFRCWLEEQMHRELHEGPGNEHGDQISSMRRPLLTPLEADACLAGLPGVSPPHAAAPANRHAMAVAAMSNVLAVESWRDDPQVLHTLKPVLMRLCANYLLRERRRVSALDPVANFHLRNGAWLWRINWEGDNTTAGMSRSYGMMVNYRYILDDLEDNHRKYIETGWISASEGVIALAEGSEHNNNSSQYFDCQNNM